MYIYIYIHVHVCVYVCICVHTSECLGSLVSPEDGCRNPAKSTHEVPAAESRKESPPRGSVGVGFRGLGV